MPKDPRLYANITHDFADSPKLICVSVEARWALLEMILYSCRMQTDGRISKRLAAAKWSLDVCQELATNDDEFPSLIEHENDYEIHDFAQHQTTKAEIEARREQKRAAGRLGGKAKARRSKATSSRTLAGAKHDAKHSAKQTASRTLAEPLAKPGISKKKEVEGETPHFDSLEALADAHASRYLCDTHKHLDPKNVPPCLACKRKREAAEAKESAAKAQAKAARRQAIDACNECDDNGIRYANGIATKCDHQQAKKAGPY